MQHEESRERFTISDICSFPTFSPNFYRCNFLYEYFTLFRRGCYLLKNRLTRATFSNAFPEYSTVFLSGLSNSLFP